MSGQAGFGARLLRDAHLHLAEHGEELSCVHLQDCAGVEDCLRRVAAAADAVSGDGAAAEDGRWIRATGARIEAWRERRYPTARELEEAGNGRPVVVVSFDHHALAVSERVLKLAGIERGTPDPPGGLIERGPDGEPTGVLLEGARELVRRVQSRVSDEQYAEYVRIAQADLRRYGFVEVHDMLATPRLARTLIELERRGGLEPAVDLYAREEVVEEVRAAAEDCKSGRVRFRGMKIFVDGTLNSRTAWMLEPFADPIPDHPCGTPFFTAEELDRVMARCAEQKIELAAHAIGDAAVRAVLDAYERARTSGAAFRCRIEHAEFIDEADIDRFARLGESGVVVASMQPCHLLTDIEAIRRLTPDRAGRAFPLRELWDSAVRHGVDPAAMILLGSDTPIVSPDPGDNVQAAVHRRRAGMSAEEAVGVEQALREEEVRELMGARR